MRTLDIHIIGSSSKGNAIYIHDGVSGLLLDAGVSFGRLSRELDLNRVEAVLVTHEHLDHCRAVPELIRRGARCYMSGGTYEKIDSMGWTNHAVALTQIETDNWFILPFDVDHDAAEPLGYLIESKATGAKIVYAVDMPAIEYDFTGVTHYLVEANYAEDLLEKAGYEEFVKDRVRRSHMSEENLIKFLKSSDLTRTEEIWLLHMSEANSDEKRFVQNVQRATGRPVYTALSS